MRKLLLAVAVALMAWAAYVVPLPLVALAPIPAKPVADVISIGRPRDQIRGKLLFTAVQVSPLTAVSGLAAWPDPYRNVTFQQRLIPQNIDPQEFNQAQQAVFAESLQVAAAVGERLAGLDVKVSGEGARVSAVLPGSPAKQDLRSGDVIIEAGEEPIRLAAQLVTLVSRLQPGQKIPLTVIRGEQRLQITMTAQLLPRLDRPGLGVLVRTVNQRIRLAVPVRLEPDVAVGGPSAGLMMALTVYDLLDPADLAAGRVIAGTGTVDIAGRVSPVGGIPEKVRGAQLAGATVFLVPASQAKQARTVAPADMQVIGVATAADAVRGLQP